MGPMVCPTTTTTTTIYYYYILLTTSTTKAVENLFTRCGRARYTMMMENEFLFH